MILADGNSRKAVGVQGKDAAAKHWVFPLFISVMTSGYQNLYADCKMYS